MKPPRTMARLNNAAPGGSGGPSHASHALPAHSTEGSEPSPLTLTLFVPGQLTNPLNGSHRHWSARAKWAEAWRTRTQVAWFQAGQPSWEGPAHVTFTAQVRRRFDDDNLAACIKPIRDAATRAICGTDDGPNCGHWFTYRQNISPVFQRGVLITITPLVTRPAAGAEGKG